MTDRVEYYEPDRKKQAGGGAMLGMGLGFVFLNGFDPASMGATQIGAIVGTLALVAGFAAYTLAG